MTFLEAVARMEGFGVPHGRSTRNNNPGDIEAGKFAQAHGATGSDGRFAIFPDPDTGFAAMKLLFQAPSYKGLTVAAALNKWAPPVENATNHYIASVCSWANCKPTDVIDELL
jgi:hypothetical protein